MATVRFNWRYSNKSAGYAFEAGDTYDLEDAVIEWLNRDSPGCCTVIDAVGTRAMTAPPQHRMMTNPSGLRDIETIADDQPDPVEPEPEPINASSHAIKLAAEKGVDLAQVMGTGNAGLITKRDVETFLGLPGGDSAQPGVAHAATKSGKGY